MLGALPSSGKGKKAENTGMNPWEQDGNHEKIFPACFVLHTLNHSPVTASVTLVVGTFPKDHDGKWNGAQGYSKRSVLILPRVSEELGFRLGSVSEHFQQDPQGVHTHPALTPANTGPSLLHNQQPWDVSRKTELHS